MCGLAADTERMHRKQIVHEYVRSAAVEPRVAHPLASGLLSVYFGADILEVVEWQTAGSDDQRALLIVHRNEWFLVTVNSGSALDADPLDYQAEVATVRIGEAPGRPRHTGRALGGGQFASVVSARDDLPGAQSGSGNA